MRDPTMGRREALRISAVVGLGTVFGGGITAAVLRDAGVHRVRATRTRMGTLVTLTVVHEDRATASWMVERAFAEMDQLENVLSRHRRESALGRLNRAGRLDDPPGALVEVLRAARTLSVASSGAFDPTVLPLLRAHEAAFRTTGHPPRAERIRAARALVGADAIELDGGGVRLQERGMAITLDGIAKGYIVDRAAETLVNAGAERVLVDAGGDVASAGPGSRREPWVVALEDPDRDPRRPGGRTGRRARVRLEGSAVATSGDYLQSFTPDRRHHHLLDPRSGHSPDATSSVSVVAPTAMLADALSCALMVLDPEEGLRLLARYPGAEALLVGKDGRRMASPGLGGRLA